MSAGDRTAHASNRQPRSLAEACKKAEQVSVSSRAASYLIARPGCFGMVKRGAPLGHTTYKPSHVDCFGIGTHYQQLLESLMLPGSCPAVPQDIWLSGPQG